MMKNINYLDHPYWIPKCLNVGRISIPLQIFPYIFPPNLYSNRLHDWKCKNSHWPPYYLGILTISESFDTVAFVRILWCSCRVQYWPKNIQWSKVVLVMALSLKANFSSISCSFSFFMCTNGNIYWSKMLLHLLSYIEGNSISWVKFGFKITIILILTFFVSFLMCTGRDTRKIVAVCGRYRWDLTEKCLRWFSWRHSIIKLDFLQLRYAHCYSWGP